MGLLGLASLHLADTNMNGTIPEEVYKMPLIFLDISGASFSGTISPSLGVLSNLGYFDIANNNFSGTLPGEIGTLSNLEQIKLNGNNFSSGSVPSFLCELRGPKKQYWELAADCLPDDTTGIPSMECPRTCCTTCCDPKRNLCQ